MSRETGGIKLIRECLSLSFELQSLIQAGMFSTAPRLNGNISKL